MSKPHHNENLCKNCKYRFRRVFIPLDTYEYTDINTTKNQLLNEEDIVILNHCLLLDMNIDLETTIECSHFTRRESDNEINLFKHDI